MSPYQFCVTDTGTAQSTVSAVDANGNPVAGTPGLHLFTDAEVR